MAGACGLGLFCSGIEALDWTDDGVVYCGGAAKDAP